MRHPFGHGKIENIFGPVEALLIFIAARLDDLRSDQKADAPETDRNGRLGGVSC